MSCRVDLTTAAARQIELPRPTRERVLDAVDDLADDPRPHGANLIGEEMAWRIRVGDHRVIHDVRDGELAVMVEIPRMTTTSPSGGPPGERGWSSVTR